MIPQEAIIFIKECGLNIENPIHDIVEDCIVSALEKQIPKKPNETEAYPHRLYCPNCYYPFERNKSEIALIREHFIVGNKYCPDCGQALDWSDTND